MVDDIFKQLTETRDEEKRELILLDFSLSQLSFDLKKAVLAAAIPHWFDIPFLAAILDVQEKELNLWNQLIGLSFVEPFPGKGYNIHERTRHLLLKQLWQNNLLLYREYSSRATNYCLKQNLEVTSWHAEWVYHVLLLEPSKRDSQLSKFDFDEINKKKPSEKIFSKFLNEHVDAGRLSQSELEQLLPNSLLKMVGNKRSSNVWSPIQAIRDFFGSTEAKPGNPDRTIYLEDLIFQHRSFDVKGIAATGEPTLDLERVFIDVGVGPSQDKASATPILSLQKNAREERHSIWRFLLHQESERPRNLVVLGAPGTGKTTLLKHITLSLANPTQDAPRLDKTPVFLFLRDIAGQIQQNPHFSLRQAVQKLLISRQISVSLDWFAKELADGRCLIMLDGLDEVANLELRQQVAAWVQRQIKQHSNNQFIITSRPFGYESNPLPQTLLLEVKLFTIEQVRLFVKNWYLATEIQTERRDDGTVRRDAAIRAADLMQALHQHPAFLEMAVNPLLLTMIATIHHYRNSLPDQRVALYEEICDVFLGRRQKARGLTFELAPPQKKRVLQSLAYEMMRRNLRNIFSADAANIIDPALKRVQPEGTSQQFLEMIANTSGLLVEKMPGVFSFAHFTFQEYLTAVYIKEQRLEQVLLEHVENAWWHETIRLYAAQANATNIIRACVMREPTSIPALTLAVECLDEALEVEDAFRKISAELVRSIEDDNPEIRRIGAEIILLLRLRRLVRLDETTYADQSLVTQAEYQLFLDEMRENGSYRQPDHWTDRQFIRGTGQQPIAGVRPSDAQAFCHWLSERDPGPWRYRLPTAQEKAQPLLNRPALEDETSPVGYWYLNNEQAAVEPLANLPQDMALMQTMQRQLEQKILNDLSAFQGFAEIEPISTYMRENILARAKWRAYSALDMERRLPFIASGEEISRFLSLIQDRNAEGFAIDMEQALIDANAHFDNPNLAAARVPILEEISTIGNRLLASLDNLPLSLEITQIMHQLMHDLRRAREQLITVRQGLEAEFLSYRESIRHLNQALNNAQRLLDKLSHSRGDARIRLRINVLQRSLQLLRRHSSLTEEEASISRQERLQHFQIFIDLYIDMIILEGRANNSMRALEGIRIVRESVKN